MTEIVMTIAGIVLSGRMNSSSSSLASGIEMDCIAAAVIGGEDGMTATVKAGPSPALIGGICAGAVVVIGAIVGIVVAKKKRG